MTSPANAKKRMSRDNARPRAAPTINSASAGKAPAYKRAHVARQILVGRPPGRRRRSQKSLRGPSSPKRSATNRVAASPDAASRAAHPRIVLYMFNISITQEIAVPVASSEATATEPYFYDTAMPGYEPTADAVPVPEYTIETQTVAVRSLLTMEGIRHMFTSFLPNFAGFTVVAVVLVAMLGVGVAEEAGMMGVRI